MCRLLICWDHIPISSFALAPGLESAGLVLCSPSVLRVNHLILEAPPGGRRDVYRLDRLLFSLVPPPPNAGRWTPARLWLLQAPEFSGASLGLNLTPWPCQSPTKGPLSHGKEILFLRTF